MKPNYELKNEAKKILENKCSWYVLLAVPVFLINSLSMIFLVNDYWQDNQNLTEVIDGLKDIFSTYVPNFFSFTEKLNLVTLIFFLLSLIVSFFMVWMIWLSLGIKREKITKLNLRKFIEFSPINRFFLFLAATLLQGIYLFFWTVFLIVPGIVKHYSYAMTYFLLKDDSQHSVSDVITISRKMMHGHKFRLFLLDLSFLPWHLLNILTLGLSSFWTLGYISATKVCFYENLMLEKSPSL